MYDYPFSVLLQTTYASLEHREWRGVRRAAAVHPFHAGMDVGSSAGSLGQVGFPAKPDPLLPKTMFGCIVFYKCY